MRFLEMTTCRGRSTQWMLLRAQNVKTCPVAECGNDHVLLNFPPLFCSGYRCPRLFDKLLISIRQQRFHVPYLWDQVPA